VCICVPISREELADVVKQQEKLCVDCWGALGSAPSPLACAQAIQGKLVTPAQLVEAMEDVWLVFQSASCDVDL